jgi:regulator of protease activity HflC (stomatin/prohibitin superfamily)
MPSPSFSLASALAALAALAILAALSLRRIPPGQVYALRRLGGGMRVVGAGTHVVLPLLERVAQRISLGGSMVPVEALALAGRRHRAAVYFQVLDAGRALRVMGDVESLLRGSLARLASSESLPDTAEARRGWLKQALNGELRERGLLVARVDLAETD